MTTEEKIGIVVSKKMHKTVIVKVESRYPHPLYSKVIIKTKKYYVHDEFNTSKEGKLIVIEKCRPLSKKKMWILNPFKSFNNFSN
uniref:Small ribosomal subunit protein uS17c n=1 Tax=Astrosyne radiata TaxID=1158023 RepID=A0A2U9NTD8_9STRA|nr:ribosomal protein S17 [Astrosyne radiata]AWT40358.1 ribosomal protein S17 [Astrosyne radiata]